MAVLTCCLFACAAEPLPELQPLPLTVEDPGPTDRLAIVTYNVQGDPTGENLRLSRLLRVIEEERPDIVVLQEVAPWALRVIAADEWVRSSGYAATTLDGQTASPFGLLVLNRCPIEETRHLGLEDGQGRVGLVTTLRVNGLRVGVGNVHLSSLLEDGPARADELDLVFAALADFDQAILAGDFNFGDGEEPESSHLDGSFRDAWTVLHPGEPGFTWDMQQSAQARKRAYAGEHSRRLEWVLLRSRRWAPEEATVIGNQAAPSRSSPLPFRPLWPGGRGSAGTLRDPPANPGPGRKGPEPLSPAAARPGLDQVAGVCAGHEDHRPRAERRPCLRLLRRLPERGLMVHRRKSAVPGHVAWFSGGAQRPRCGTACGPRTGAGAARWSDELNRPRAASRGRCRAPGPAAGPLAPGRRASLAAPAIRVGPSRAGRGVQLRVAGAAARRHPVQSSHVRGSATSRAPSGGRTVRPPK